MHLPRPFPLLLAAVRAAAALDVNCNDPTCLDVVAGRACDVAGSFAALVACVGRGATAAAADPAAAVCACHSCVGGKLSRAVLASRECKVPTYPAPPEEVEAEVP